MKIGIMNWDIRAITTEELLHQYYFGKRDFQGVILESIDLDGVQLEGVNFTGAVFNEVSFKSIPINLHSNWHFSNCMFVNCNLSWSHWLFCEMPELFGCNLRYTIMQGCYFRRQFVDCDWRDSVVVGATFDDVIFTGCNLMGQKYIRSPSIKMERREFISFGLMLRDSFDRDGIFHSWFY